MIQERTAMYDNLNNYKAFYTVAKLGSISRAADTLYVSQPALSKSIQKLEEGLSVRLFDRNARGVTLTDEGAILYEHIKTAFDTIGKGEEELKRIGGLGLGHLRIGVSTSLCKYVLIGYLQSFIMENPHIKVTIDCHATANTMTLLADGKIDLGLICETDIPRDFTYQPLTEIHDIFVASDAYLSNLKVREYEQTIGKTYANGDSSPDVPLLFAGNLTPYMAQRNTADENELPVNKIIEKSNLMMLEAGNVTRTHVDRYMNEQGIHPNQILEVSNMDLLIDFASIGMGVACVVREFAKDYLDSGQIQELKLKKPIKKRTVGLVYTKSKNKTTALSKFISSVTAQLNP